MKKIKLTQNKTTIIDDEDFEKINNYKWHAVFDKKLKTYYARTNINNKTTPLHRFLMNPDKSLVVHHKDHNTLNNSKNNLIICTKQQNRWCSRKQARTKNKYKGVTHGFDIKSKKFYGYIAEITFNRKRYNLGFFKNEKDAALAYNKAAIKFFGDFALLNKV